MHKKVYLFFFIRYLEQSGTKATAMDTVMLS